jgi:ABC-type dipeptide/oligopeptide/nickel transport system ATPase subunit
MNTATPLLEVRDIGKTFRARASVIRALSGVSLSIQPGQFVGVVGESGSGKSTLARVIMGLESADSGEVSLDGRPAPQRRTRAQRRLVQMVFQDPRSSLNPRMSIMDSVEDFAIVHRLGDRAERKLRAARALDQVHLSSTVASRRPPELSGGQLQRACLARALITEPKLLVADEPTSSLDVSIQGQILNLLDELRGSLSILLISHDMGVIRFMCDEIHVMLNGEVVESARAAELFENAQHPYTRKLIHASFLEEIDVQ